jgi:hypothetical protein
VAVLLGGTAVPSQSQPLAPDYTVVWHKPDRERYVEGCGLVRFDKDDIVAVVPVVPRSQWSAERRATQSRTHIVRSVDGGKTWKPTSELPYYSAVPWVHQGRLYLFAMKGGTKFRNDDLLLLRSDDRGKTWSAPLTLAEGHFWNCHTGMVVQGKRLYWAIDDISFGMLGVGSRGPRIVAGDLSENIMDPKSWRLSNPVRFVGVPEALTSPRFAEHQSQYLEPNVIQLNGKIRVLATVKPRRQTTAGLSAVFDLSEEGGGLELKFTQFNPMPGGQLKFFVEWDEVSRMFWATANLVVDSQGVYPWWKQVHAKGTYRSETGGNDRRTLMLMYCLDGLNWFQAGCVAQAARISQSFMYAALVIDGDDLAIISRSSVNAPDNHDADYATFHRVRNFRSLALKLVPEPEAD